MLASAVLVGVGVEMFFTVSIRDESILDSNGILGVTGTPLK